MSALVGLFDSGLGGLTVLRRLQERYPHSSCLYLGDTARVPYGQRSVADIRAIAAEVVAWLRHQQVGVLVMACNTSNALALDVAVVEAGVPVVGLIDSVAADLGSDRVGVLATSATAASGAYRRAIHACHPHAQVLEIGCPAFVPLIEAAEAAVKRLGPLLASMGGMPEGELSGVAVVPPADRTRVCVSGCAEAFADGASRWLGYRPAVERVDLRSVG